jgi:hypothetical protein
MLGSNDGAPGRRRRRDARRLGAKALVCLAALLALAFAACSGDGGSGQDGAATPTPSPQGFFFPKPYSDTEARLAFQEIEAMLRNPDPALVARYGILPGELQARIGVIMNGEGESPGLADAIAAFEAGDRILAGEYLHYVAIYYVAPTFSGDDLDPIDGELLRDIDPARQFDESPDDGMACTAVFKAALIKMIQLWYRL